MAQLGTVWPINTPTWKLSSYTFLVNKRSSSLLLLLLLLCLVFFLLVWLGEIIWLFHWEEFWSLFYSLPLVLNFWVIWTWAGMGVSLAQAQNLFHLSIGWSLNIFTKFWRWGCKWVDQVLLCLSLLERWLNVVELRLTHLNWDLVELEHRFD